jgi:hypothetical protein
VDVCYGNGSLACTDARKCEVYCAAPYLTNPAGTGCATPRIAGFQVAPDLWPKSEFTLVNNTSAATKAGLCNSTPITSVYVSPSSCYNPGVPGAGCSALLW